MFDVYLRRRIAFLAVFGALVAGGLRFAAPSNGARPTVSYTVQPGDTLWSIASAGDAGDPRAGVAAIRRVNDLASDTIRPGDVLLLP
jgi:LysM repeat protein